MAKKTSKKLATANEEQTQAMKLASKTIRKLSEWSNRGVLTTNDEFHDAGKAYNAARKIIEEAEAERKDITRDLDAAKKKIMAKYKTVTDPLGKLKEHLGNLGARYDEALRTKHIQAAETRAKVAEKKGEKQFAQDIRNAALIEDVLPPSAEWSFVPQWRGDITDIREVCRLIAIGELPMDLIQPNQKKLDELAKMYREQLGEVFEGLKSVCLRRPRGK